MPPCLAVGASRVTNLTVVPGRAILRVELLLKRKASQIKQASVCQRQAAVGGRLLSAGEDGIYDTKGLFGHCVVAYDSR